MQTPSSTSGHKAHRSETSITLSVSSGPGFPKQIALHSQSKSDDKQFIVTLPTTNTEVRAHKQTRSQEYSCIQQPPAYLMVGRHSMRGDKSFVTSLETNTSEFVTTKPLSHHHVTASSGGAARSGHVTLHPHGQVTGIDHQKSHSDTLVPTTPVVYLNKDSKGGNIAHVHVTPALRVKDALLQGHNYPPNSSQKNSRSDTSDGGILSQLMKEFRPVSTKVTTTEITTPSVYVQSSLPAPYSPSSHYHQRDIGGSAARFGRLSSGRDIGYNTIGPEYDRAMQSKRVSGGHSVSPLAVTEFFPTSPPFERSTPPPLTTMSAPASASNTIKIDHETLAARATQMVEILSDENKSLRKELEKMYEKVAKLQKFERDIMKVQADHEMLVETSRKREQLETVYKWKLENEIKRLQQHNRQLMTKMEQLHAHYTNRESETAQQKVETGELHSELHKRGAMIAELAAQRQESDMSYARMEEEMLAQRVTLDEQRLHIEVLDNALSNAQANVVKLQEECKRRQSFVDKGGMLESLLGTLQKAMQKREIKEQQLREHLEKEVERLKNEKRNALQDEGVSGLEDSESMSLADLLREKDETILRLETEVSKWEQKYYEECALRHSLEIPRGSPELQIREAGEGSSDRSSSSIDTPQKMNNEVDANMNKLKAQLDQKDVLIQILRQQIQERDSSMSSASSRPTSISPNSSIQNIHRNSSDSLTNRISPGNSVTSLQGMTQRSPQSSNQNLSVGGLSRSPVVSMQNLSLTPHASSSPVGSQQNLMSIRHGPPPMSGSQERIQGVPDSGPPHPSPGSIGASGSDSDLSRERSALDEKLKQLDQEIEERDKILGKMWMS